MRLDYHASRDPERRAAGLLAVFPLDLRQVQEKTGLIAEHDVRVASIVTEPGCGIGRQSSIATLPSGNSSISRPFVVVGH